MAKYILKRDIDNFIGQNRKELEKLLIDSEIIGQGKDAKLTHEELITIANHVRELNPLITVRIYYYLTLFEFFNQVVSYDRLTVFDGYKKNGKTMKFRKDAAV